MQITDTGAIQAALSAVGIVIDDQEAAHLGPIVMAILKDLGRLDELEQEQPDPTPRFVVEEGK